MSINYNNIVELIELLYNFVYNPKNDIYNNYMYKRLDPENILLSQVLKTDTFVVDNEKILVKSDNLENFKFIQTITNTLGEKKIILKKDLSNYLITIIIQKHNSNIKDTVNMIDIYYELMLNQIVSEFVIIDKIPFYLLNICNVNLDHKQIAAYPNIKEIITKEFNIFDPSDFNSLYCLSVYEHYTPYITLRELFKENISDDIISSILFQVLFSHAYLNFKLGNFRHNSFTIDSFYVSKPEKLTTFVLTIGDLSFKLEYTHMSKKV